MLPWLTLTLLAAVGAAAYRAPKALLRAYRASFVARHGVGVQIGVTVLATVTLAMLVATLREPSTHPRMEIVDIGVVLLGIVAGSVDLYLFGRKTRS